MTNRADDNLIYWMWLTMALGPANPRKWEIIKPYDSIVSAYEDISNGGGALTSSESKKANGTDLDSAQKMLEYCASKGITVLSYESEGYPQRLREIYNPPTVLFCLGNPDYVDSRVCIGVVGTRKPSDYTVSVTEWLCSELVDYGSVIVSGFALGVDSAAHRAALLRGGRTIAVLGCGLLYGYPAPNVKAKALIARHGAVISEYFPDDKPTTYTFPARNRILSGLCDGIIITQAGVRSGALNTASHAVSQGRDIFCVPPHDIRAEAYGGVISLLRDGAIPVFSAEDIIAEYYTAYSHKLKLPKKHLNRTENITLLSENEPKKDAKKPVKSKNNEDTAKEPEKDKAKAERNLSGLSKSQRQLCEYLCENGSCLVDELAENLSMDTDEILYEMTELELEGIVRKLPGNRYEIL